MMNLRRGLPKRLSDELANNASQLGVQQENGVGRGQLRSVITALFAGVRPMPYLPRRLSVWIPSCREPAVRLLPRDEEFFRMFAALADRITAAARLLHALFREPDRMAELVTAIKGLEHEADDVTHTVIERIDTSFITPIDREDIHLLASRLDDVIDLIDGTARRAQMFRICEVRQPAVDLTSILVRACEAVEGAVTSVKKPKIVVQTSTQVKRLEEEGDALYHEAMGSLFDGEPDPLDVIKWKELYDMLERAIDQCEDVANTLESIALKNG